MQTLNSKRVVDWRKRARKVLIEVLGNKCAICGYEDDFPGAYDIHHISPELKEINFGNLSTLGIRKCLLEAEKCVLLCAICHRKIHAGIIDISESKYFYNKDLANEYISSGKTVPSSHERLERRKKVLIKNYCIDCGKEITKRSKRCWDCNAINSRTVERPDINTLLKDIETLGYNGTGRKYGVHASTIHKWVT
jgi:hypothetical protein